MSEVHVMGSPMLRAAKISSWILLSLYLIIILVSARGGAPALGADNLLFPLPMALALGVFYSRAPRWFAWGAFAVNCAGVALGLYLLGSVLPDLIGLSSDPDVGTAGILAAVAILILVLPCALNAVALYSAITRKNAVSADAAG